MIRTDKQMTCPNCKGSGKQEFHGHFSSYIGTCDFCNGVGSMDAFAQVFVPKVKEKKRSDSHDQDE